MQLTNKSLNIFDVLVVLDDVGNNADTSPYTAARLVLFLKLIVSSPLYVTFELLNVIYFTPLDEYVQRYFPSAVPVRLIVVPDTVVLEPDTRDNVPPVPQFTVNVPFVYKEKSNVAPDDKFVVLATNFPYMHPLSVST